MPAELNGSTRVEGLKPCEAARARSETFAHCSLTPHRRLRRSAVTAASSTLQRDQTNKPVRADCVSHLETRGLHQIGQVFPAPGAACGSG